jgi:tetratricopeptide (TPR) repeat protein
LIRLITMTNKIPQMMKTIKQATLALVMLAVGSFAAMAQGYKVESVRMVLENPDPTAEQNLSKCIEDIEAAAEHPKTSNDPKMYYYKGLTYFNVYATNDEELQKQVPNALDISTSSFFKAIETDNKNRYTKNATFYLMNCAIGLYNLGINAYNNKEYDQAVAYYDQVLKIIPLDENDELKRKNITPEAMYQYKYYAGMAAEDWDLAKDNLQKLIDLNFMEPRIYTDMARILLTEEDTTKALEYISQGKEMFENDKTLINMELDIYLKQGRSDELITKLNNAIDSDNGNPMYWFARAITYEGMGEKDKAEADYKKTIEVDPNFYDAYYNMGVMYINKSNALVEKLNEVYKQSEFDKIDNEITELYKVAIGYFEGALENPDMGEAERKDLASTMKRIYAKLKNEAKVAEMKSIIDN